MYFNSETNSFAHPVKTDPRASIHTEVGDSKQPEIIYPQFKTMHWDNECNFSVRYLADDYLNATVLQEADGTVRWNGDGLSVRIYPTNSVHDDGGFEFEAIYDAKPVSNVLQFSIRSKSLEFLYQDELTADEIAHGAKRPDDIVGSYAVYHASRSGDVVGGKSYRAGKAFHILRPHAVDAAGTKVWCRLWISGESMTITIPQDFLDTAQYPVVVDPTFGYTTIGGSTDTWDGSALLYNQATATPASDGTLTKLTLYCAIFSGSPVFNPAIYSDTIGAPDVRLASSEVGPSVPASAALTDAALSYASITTGVTYWLGFKCETGIININYDAASVMQHRLDGPITWPNPAVPTGSTAERVTIYGTYTTSGGGSGPAIYVARSQILVPGPRRTQIIQM